MLLHMALQNIYFRLMSGLSLWTLTDRMKSNENRAFGRTDNSLIRGVLDKGQ